MTRLRKLLKLPRGRFTLLGLRDRLGARFTGHAASTMSRYLRCIDSFPPEHFLHALHRAACEDAGEKLVGITVDELVQMRAAAWNAHCPNCTRYLKKIKRLEAGLVAAPAATKSPAPLPVPPADGDRQRISYDDAVTRLVARADELLTRARQAEALALLGEAPALLSPVQNAACVDLFRKQNLGVLADTLIQIFAHDQPEKNVMRFASSLLTAGMANDAGILLKSAVEE